LATLRVLKAEMGGYVGHSATHLDLVEAARALEGQEDDSPPVRGEKR
jgi:fructose 1,6-bisphosphatase